jgi:hypothetical protein
MKAVRRVFREEVRSQTYAASVIHPVGFWKFDFVMILYHEERVINSGIIKSLLLPILALILLK